MDESTDKCSATHADTHKSKNDETWTGESKAEHWTSINHLKHPITRQQWKQTA